MDEFLDKLQEDQRRMRKFLRSHGPRFKRMGEVLAASRTVGARVFLVGEPPLDGLAAVLANEYLTHLPVIPIDLTRPAPPSVDADASDEVAMGRAGAAKQAARHLHAGDVLLAFLHEGTDKETRVVCEAARAKRLAVLVVGGLGAKGYARRVARVRVNLPTRGIKTICESAFVCSRILARISRAAWREAAGGEDQYLVNVLCDTCNERVFLEEQFRGKATTCPLCQARLRVPRDSSRRLDVVVSSARTSDEGTIGGASSKRRRPKPSVLEFQAPALDESSADEADEESLDDVGSLASAGSRSRPRSAPPLPAPDSDDLEDDEELEEESLDDEELEEESLDDEELEEESLDDEEDADEDVEEESLDDEEDADEDVEEEDPRVAPTAPSSGSASPPVDSFQEPVGLVSHELPPDGPSFGSDIVVGSDVVSASAPPSRPTMATTQSADPYALEDAFLADLEVPPDQRGSSGSESSDVGSSSRRLSSRYTIRECKLRWGRGGYPDATSPEHGLIQLKVHELQFFLDPDDEAGSTLQKGDELYVSIQIPAFIEPIHVRGLLKDITGTSGSGGRGTRILLEFVDVEPSVRRKLARAAENTGAPA